ncbi:putative DEAD/DEAH box helicase [Ascodesmis nigricans]|uniref:Putative DEAD/DEAH box helicase n=1 Tax=Ascodesmis nigricans TaxID=341454 RepID=A0A4S2MYJ2_9PEZI|nr:putative DEAD/DEAH box helicase [Ascodesmis nigricans]
MAPHFTGPTNEADWLAELTAMQDAIAKLQISTVTPEYGADIDLDDEDLSASGDDFDDLFDEETGIDRVYSSDGLDGEIFDHRWLERKIDEYSARNGLGFKGGELHDKLLTILSSKDSDNALQSILLDILGFDDLELVSELIQHRREIVQSSQNKVQPGGGEDALLRLMTREQREEAQRLADWEHKTRPLGPKLSDPTANYPHIYRTHDAGNTLSAFGKKYALPMGSLDLDHKLYKEIIIPPNKVGVVRGNERLVPINEMDMLCQKTFKGYKSLNRMQSLVYPVAYKTNENMLICAPTGAGKTDTAMLTILHTIAMNCTPDPREDPKAEDFFCDKDEFKIIYVAPMKALAAEIVDKFKKRLSWMGIEVRELTGDMHLTKAEIVKTQIIVTTPEKWDVVTRKSTGDTELVHKVRLLILDEVHMLHDERGAVIESIVARTQRQVESTQSMIRIVGLSATLPNYVDVGEFLKVNPYAGLFYFDGSFRPVPLEQHFVGVRGKLGTRAANENLDRAAYEKVKDMVQAGHQVMVFVHSRKDTVKTAKMLYDMAQDEGLANLFDTSSHPNYDAARRDMERSKGRELRDLFKKGFGIHHAGMLRSDRNLMERVFSMGAINVLCCTATLAWGVNLPAAAVVIKGTQVYNAQKGGFNDLGILDVLQIFGRAGRPQFQEFGRGFIVTNEQKLAHYLTAVTQQIPIESRLVEKIVDNLNAEIALGTVTTIDEGVQWLGYSYLFVRWKKNPLAYGINWDELIDDPSLAGKRRELIILAARRLQSIQMIIFDERTESLSPKDVGRIASNYYILSNSIEIFNMLMKPNATEADVLKMLSVSGEFDNIQTRESDYHELWRLKDEFCPCDLPTPPPPKEKVVTAGSSKGHAQQSGPGSKGREQNAVSERGEISPHGKTNILLQSYISRANLEDFALVSDSAYVAQNAGRICRALFHMALNRRWGALCEVLLSMCKSIEKRQWSFQHPLGQFDLPVHIVHNMEVKESTSSIEALRDMEPGEISSLVRNSLMGPRIATLLEKFPTLTLDAEIAPLNRDVLKIKLFITPEFHWDDRIHGNSESYWIWAENSDTSEIYHSEYFILARKKLWDDHELNFTIPLSDPMPSQIYIRAISDRWLGAETVTPVSFQHLIRPDTEVLHTDLLNLQPLPITALKNPKLEAIYGSRFKFFNPMQTQIFHTLYHTANNVLLGSPTGSGKTIACELAMWWAFREKPGSKVVYIAPMKALVRERVKDWSARLTGPMGLKLVELTGDNTPDTRSIRDADIIITTPEKWDGISRSWQTRSYVRQVSLVIIDEIHLLGGDRGPILEIIVSRMNYIASQTNNPVRLMGMSTACANATDLANWLGVKKHGLYNFRHSVRPVPLETYIDGFAQQSGFCPLMQSMNRPAFLAIKSHSPNKPVIIFVASRRQTRLTAKDLINFCGMEDNPRRFLNLEEDELQVLLTKVHDDSLKESLQFGIGLHHAGLVESDRQIVEELFTFNKIQVLVATATLAWGVNLPAHLVIVKGTQFYDAKIEGYRDMDLTDVLQMLGRAGRPQFDTSGIACIFTQEAKKAYYKYFLHTGFPVESTLHKVVDDHLGAEIAAGTIKTKQDALDYLTWTFFFRRLHKNPTYYGLQIAADEQDTTAAQEEANQYMIQMVNTAVGELAKSGCVMAFNNGDVESTTLGRIASYYYLSHKTIRSLIAEAKKGATVEDALRWMSIATEYDELPVRHNEDLVNMELSRALPFGTDRFDVPLWDPHVKAYLLVQAYLGRVELPIPDYITDQNTVLDQTIRILQASIDALTELGHLSSVLILISLMQGIKQARWPTDSPLSMLPHISPQLEAAFPTFKGLVPADISRLAPPDFRKLAQKHDVRNPEILINAAKAMPNIEIKISQATAEKVVMTVERLNQPMNRDFKARTPLFPKSQTEGWFAIVGNTQTDEIYALKRVSWSSAGGQGGRGRKVEAKVTLELPPGLDETDATVWVVSDVYLGVERRLGVRLQTNQVVPGVWVEKPEMGTGSNGGEASGTVVKE